MTDTGAEDDRILEDYCWKDDLFYFDGPILSVYQHRSGPYALFLWVDETAGLNTWLVAEFPNLADLERLNKRRETLLEFIKKSTRILLFGQKHGMEPQPLVQVSFDQIPEDYLPTEESWLPDLDRNFREGG